MSTIYDQEAFYREYAKMARSEKGLEGAGEWHQLRRLFPDLAGKRVLDLGCGYGWHCRYAAEQGAASVTGIDLSERMIQTARDRNSHPAIQYRVCGLEAFEYPEMHYDVVISNLVLHYVEDLQKVYRHINRTLKKDGIFVMNIEHPSFTGSVNEDWIYDDAGRPVYWPIDRYYDPGPRRTLFLGQEVIKQHHTLTQIINGLLESGFSLEAVEEAVPDPAMLHLPGMEDEMRRPMMLLVRAKKL